MTLDTNKLTLYVGDTYQLNPVLSPEPTLDIDKELVFESFNSEVASVDENGVITAVSEGYAYINVETASGAVVKSYVLVEVLPCMAHNYGDWEVTTEAGCETAGVETRKCIKCGSTDTREISAKGHSYGDWVTTKEPTATEDGLKEKTCACGDKITEVIPATGEEETTTPEEETTTPEEETSTPEEESTPEVTTPEETTPEVTTPEEVTTKEEQTTEKASGGTCGGVIGAGTIFAILALGVCVVAKKKED